MSSSPQLATDWRVFLTTVANQLRELTANQWKLHPDGSGPDIFLALHRLFGSFPFPLDIALLDTTGVECNRKEGQYATLFRYDLAQHNTFSARFHGVIPIADLNSHISLLETVFGFEEETLNSLRKLGFTWLWSFPHFTQVVLYDPVTKIEYYAHELLSDLSSFQELLEEFSPKIDFNHKYSLQPDAVLDEAAILQVGELSACFASANRSEALERAQKWIAEIQLLPHVPEETRHVFRLAKQLYVFGLFEYHFYTISHHYAYLAVESALYHRWNAALKLPAVIEHGKDILTFANTSRISIQSLCRAHNWKPQNVKVNGRVFPNSASITITQLRDDGIINDWQLDRFKRVWLALRNSYSHLEFAPINSPSTGTLARAAEQINMLFDSVKP